MRQAKKKTPEQIEAQRIRDIDQLAQEQIRERDSRSRPRINISEIPYTKFNG